MVLNATFKQYFSYVVVVIFIGGGNQSTQREPLTCHQLVVIGTDYKGSYKSNYHMITTMAALVII